MNDDPDDVRDPQVPGGFRLAGVHCGLKRNPAKEDLTLIVSDRPATAAGVYTQNVVAAAPVVLDRERTPTDGFRALVINSGSANACTGEQGMEDARRMVRLAAETVEADEAAGLVFSTGVIGELLPMQKIEAGIRLAAERLSDDGEALAAAARGIMTTDKAPKLAGRRLDTVNGPVLISGIAKGAGMIGPRMATMLGVVLTDALLTPAEAQSLLADVTDVTFNAISVEGHTSTNDSVVLLASGAAGRLDGEAREPFRDAVLAVCEELARAIPSDGEGATHLIAVEVSGCRDRDDARRIARTVADSPLVKTAVAGGDPNWGRIVSAAGYAGVPFSPEGVSLHVNGHLLYERGTPVAFDAATVSESIRGTHETHIELRLSEGTASFRFWTSDLTVEYVRFNAEYHT